MVAGFVIRCYLDIALSNNGIAIQYVCYNLKCIVTAIVKILRSLHILSICDRI